MTKPADSNDAPNLLLIYIASKIGTPLESAGLALIVGSLQG